MRSFKDVGDRHLVSLDNKQLALFTSGAVVAAGLFFLTGVLYGTRVSLPSSGSGSLALRLDKEPGPAAVEDALPAASGSGSTTIIPIGKTAPADAEKERLLAEYARETVTELPVTEAAPAATSAKPPAPAAATAAKPVETAAKPTAPKAAPLQIAKTEAAPPKAAEGQPLLRGRKLSSMSGKYTVQVAAFTDKAQAKKEAARWEKSRFPVFTGTDKVSGKKLYRVQIGRFSDKKEAEKARDALVRDLKVKGPKIIDAVK